MTVMRIVFLVLAAAQAGCGLLSRSADEPQTPMAAIESGLSATSTDGAIWLAAGRPGLSAVGKDFLFAGPMTVNRNGVQRRYLWFALGTTVDRRLTGASEPDLESVVLLVDDTPMNFELTPWNNAADAQPYALPFASQQSYAARVTASQIRALANAKHVEGYVTDAAGRSPAYTLVHGDPASWVPAPLSAETRP